MKKIYVSLFCFFCFTYFLQSQTCGDPFTDSGGPSGEYGFNENASYQICSGTPGEIVSVSFTQFDVEPDGFFGGCYDYMIIYDGPTTASPTINPPGGGIQWCWDIFQNIGTGNLAGMTLTSTHPSGCLLFVFQSDGFSGFYYGWNATVSCAPPPSCIAPSDLQVDYVNTTSAEISWTENNSPAATEWEVEYGPAGFSQGSGTTVSVTSTSYTITGLNSNTDYDYYVRAVCVPGVDLSAWSSNTFSTSPNYCGGSSFTDSGGAGGDYTNNELNTYTICSDVPGGAVSVSFSSFSLENFGTTACFDSLTVYDGPNTSSPTINPPGGATGWCWDRGDAVPTGTGDLQGMTLTSTHPSGCLTFVFESDGSVTRAGWVASVTCSSTPVTCFVPSNLQANFVDASSAEISWTENNSPAATEWEIEYGPAGFSQGSGTTVLATSSPYTISGLNSDTEYDYYVRAVCVSGVDYSIWSGVNTFTTSPDYCGGDLFTDSGGPGGNHDNNELITYTICPDVPGGSVSVTFTSFSLEENGTTACYDGLTIYDGTTIIPTPGGGTEWCWDRGDAVPTGTGDLQGMTLTSTHSSGCLTFVFESDGSVTREGWVASVICIPPPTCFPPSSVVSTNTTFSSVELTWVDANTPLATEWQIEYGLSGFSQGNGTVVTTTTNPHTIAGLTSNTDYEYYVRAVCAPGDTSAWSSVRLFTTLIDYCGNDPFTDSGGVGGAYSPNANETYTICPDNPGDVVSVSFTSFDLESNGINGCNDYLVIYDGDNNTAPTMNPSGNLSSEWCWDESNNTGSGDLEGVTLVSSHSSGCLTFEFTSNFNVNRAGWSAEVLCSTPPGCFAPYSLNVDNVTSNSITMSWVDPNTPAISEWEVEYGPSGFALGTGTVVTANSNPFTVTGLNSETTYDLYVRSVCGVANESVSSLPLTTTTLCGLVEAPYIEDFDSLPWSTGSGTYNLGDVISPCWSRNPDPVSTNAYSWGAHTGTTTTGSSGPDQDVSSTGNYMYTEGSSPNGTVATLTSPLIDVTPLTSPELRFYYHMYGVQMGTLDVDILVNGTSTNVFSISGQQHASPSDPWTEIAVDLSAFAGDTLQVVFTGTKTGNFTTDMGIDVVQIIDNVTCPKPAPPVLVDAGADYLEVSWVDNAGASEWQIEYGPTGFTQGTGDVVNTNSNPHVLTGLLDNTDYEVYVRAICAPGDTSIWSFSSEFTTLCSVFSLPFAENFDGANWQSGTGAANVGDMIDRCWDRSPSSNLFWGIRTGQTFTVNTGPDSDVSGAGNYVYMEASGSSTPGGVSTIHTPRIDLNGAQHPFLTFSYHMFGSDMGSLDAFIVVDGIPTNVWSLSGEQQVSGTDAWSNAVVDVSAYIGDTIQVQFQGTRGNGQEGDMSVDEIEVLDVGDDVGVVAILLPEDSICQDTSVRVQVVVENFGFNDQPAIPVTVNLSGIVSASYSDSYAVDAFSTDTFDVGTFDVSNSGSITIDAYTELPADIVVVNDDIEKEVFVYALPVITTVNDTVCVGEDATISVSGADTYLWSDSQVGSSIQVSPSTSTMYYVEATDVNGCVQNDSASVEINPLPVISIVNDAICPGETGTVSASTGGNATYLWNTGDNTSAVSDDPLSTTVYDVVVTDINGCQSTSSATISVYTLPNVVAMDDTSVCLGESVSLSATGALTYVWSAGQTEVTPANTTTYIVTGTDANGCENTDYVVVEVSVPQVVDLGLHGSVYCLNSEPIVITNTTIGVLSGNGISGNTFSPDVAGVGVHTLTFSYTDDNMCQASISFDLEVAVCTGIQEIESLENVSIYPNPFHSGIHVSFTAKEYTNMTLRVVNVLGKVVHLNEYELIKGDHILRIDQTQNWSSGMYLLIFDHAKGSFSIPIMKE